MSKKKPNKPNNPDNLYQRGGTWWIRYNAGGKKIRRSLGTTSLREAKRLRDKIMVKRSAAAKFGIEEPAKAEPVKTFTQIAEMWLDSRKADGTLRKSTLADNQRIVRGVLIPVFGNMLMCTITVEDVERFIGELRKKHKRPTVATYFTTLRTVIRQSIRRGWYDGPNPLDRLERMPTQGPGRDTALTEEEATDLLTELSGQLHCKCALALYTGLRWGEVHGLAWADLSLDTDPATLTVRRSFRGKPKNAASAATVPISSDAVSLLRRWQAEQVNAFPWVFATREGHIRNSRSDGDAKEIHAAAARAGIEKCVTPHVFRHSFGTWVYERTGDPKIVQRLMRHASFNTSMGYVHDRRALGPVVNLLPSLTKPDSRVV